MLTILLFFFLQVFSKYFPKIIRPEILFFSCCIHLYYLSRGRYTSGILGDGPCRGYSVIPYSPSIIFQIPFVKFGGVKTYRTIFH